jgi:deoxyribonuclease V
LPPRQTYNYHVRITPLHPWDDLTPKQAIALQHTLTNRVRQDPPLGDFDLVAGADCSSTRFSPMLYGAVVLWRRSTGEVIETAEVVGRSRFPYVPGLLTFRELPILLEAFALLKHVPDLIVMDGQGRAHPRRLGIGSHLGLFLDLPTLGCAKSLLCGTHREPGPRRGARTRLVDKGEIIGTVLRSKERANPLFVSVGHRIDLAGAVRAVLACGRGYRLPEPTRLAHEHVGALRRRHEAQCFVT